MCLVEREAPNLGTSRELSKTRIIFKSSDLSIRRLHNASLFFETGNCLEVYSIMLESDEFTVVELLHPNVSALIDSVLRDITIRLLEESVLTVLAHLAVIILSPLLRMWEDAQ